MMRARWSSVCGLALIVAGLGCADARVQPEETAERFFRTVYGCTGESLDSLASPSVRMSYPIFAERFGSPVLVGRDAIERFSAGFCQRWREPDVTIHEVIADAGRVVLVWSYSAVSADDSASTPERSSWGGISVFELDDLGRVRAEYGEESTPGPVARMTDRPR